MAHSRHTSKSRSRSRSRQGQGQGRDGVLPSIAALFVVKFDPRQGYEDLDFPWFITRGLIEDRYKLVWSRSIPDVQLEGVVDFKSLPSGLHNVKEDLVYFIHNSCAGISAFVNVPGDKSQRNAEMLAVGALVPLTYGRLGKSWRHAEGLQKLANEHISNVDRLHMLEEYWGENRLQEGHNVEETVDESPTLIPKPSSKSSPRLNGYRRPRAISDATAMMTSRQTLSPHHPAISLPRLINDVGPLIFPLYRAALLRKRILIVGEPPVEPNFYDISIISSVPESLLPLLPVDSIPPLSLRPLFNVGVTDIPILENSPQHQSSTNTEPTSEFSPSWIACTTDDVLATKPQLYDILVDLPPSSQSAPIIHPTPPSPPAAFKKHTPYPKIYPSSPLLSRLAPQHGIKATRRDLRRYLTLRSNLRNLPSAKPPAPAPNIPPERRDRTAPRPEDDDDIEDQDSTTSDSSLFSTFSRTSVIESTPWALIAYTSFIWWASAGEKKRGLGEDDEQQVSEDEQDRALLLSGHDEAEAEEGEGQEDEERFGGLSKETAIVGYFHRLTGLIFTTVSDAISRVDGEGVRRGGDYTKYADDNENESAGRGQSREEAVHGLGLMSPSDEPADIAAGKDAGGREEGEDADTAVAAPSNGEGEDEPLLPQASSSKTPSLSSSLDEERPTALVEITSEDMAQMGLDVWSSADRSFVEELVLLWWGREAVVRGGRVECCGVRVL
ncbi:hypothetical protein EPUS_02817 [Endocarpon pusillum Z07020]|uniref:DUF4484 domain-containing protein n=1 Tax=Endocarpon pusillum (strain Z07020 / HMAS-L-300199) TaxID=1263415 RepID=U1GKX8_ENDPU|nr:uncharacterized protein EPUS_02817 [Endocarpon pusillum Z07020]ERF72536.1 hypothetical protein EPUS_02817 [Endocarpon pusillum Z07020]